MVYINKYSYPTANLYSPEGVFLGVLTNPVEFADIRLQIATNALKGYYIEYNGQNYPIDHYGKMEWGKFDIFDAEMDIISKLLRLWIENSKKVTNI